MSGETVYLNAATVEVVEEIQDDIEERYGFRPSVGQTVQHMAEEYAADGEGEDGRRTVSLYK